MAYFGNGALYNSGSKYGERLTSQPLLAICVPLSPGESVPTTTSTAKVTVSWGAPVIPYTIFRVMRARFGYPESSTTGTLVYQGTYGTAQDVSATEYLPDGSAAFYRMFALSGGSWVVVDEDWVLATSASGGHDALVAALPRMYTSAHNDPLSPPDPDNTLVRWLEGVGFWIDTFKNQAKSLVGSTDGLHPNVLIPRIQGLGITQNYPMDFLTTRRLLQDQSDFLPLKTTPRAIAQVASDITGWHCTTTSVMNLVPTLQDAAYRTGVTNSWNASTFTVVGPNTSLAVGAVDATTSPTAATAQVWANEDTAYPNTLGWARVLQVLTANALKASVATNFDTTSATTKTATAYRLVRVGQGRPYSLMLAIRQVAAAVGTPTLANTRVTVTGTWYDLDKNAISSVTFIPSSAPTSTSWTYMTGAEVSPVGAQYLSYKIEVTGDNGATCHLGGIRIEEVTNTRVNLIRNSWFESTVSNWSANANMAATWPQWIAGGIQTGALQMKALAAGAMSVISDMAPVMNNLMYSGSIYVTPATTRTVALKVQWFDITNTSIQTDTLASQSISTATQITGSATAPYNAAYASLIVEVQGAAINELATLLRTHLERGSSVPSLLLGGANGVYGSNMTPNSLVFSAAPNPYRDPRLVNVVLNPARSNFVTNPSLELSTVTGWMAVSGQTSHVYTTGAWIGANCGSVVHPTVASTQVAPWTAYMYGGDGVVGDDSLFTASVYVKLRVGSAVTGVTARIGTFWIDKNGAFSTAVYGPWTTINAASYQRIAATGISGFETAHIGMYVQVAGLAAGVDDFRYDAGQLELGAVATDYFDASTNSDAVWEGGSANAHNAHSHEYPHKTFKYGVLSKVLVDFIPAQTPYRLVLADAPDWTNVRART